ncbi:MAG: hypothetical protein H8D63_00915 [Parcubacteria group bacterium]|nr:hypothetical protein [Parcubacteria group bacterium]
MTFHLSHLRTLTLGILVPLFMFGGIIARPAPAHALFGAGDAVIVLKDITRDRTILPKELGLDGIAWKVAKMLVGDIIGDLRSFINSGFFGDELLITDPDAFFAKLSRDVTTAFMSEVSNADIYGPIKTEILKLLSQSYTPYSEYAKSSLEDILINPDAFEDGFFEGGGWTGFLAHTVMPENSAIGQGFMAAEEHARQVENALGNVKSELEQSGGLLSLPGKCLESVGVDKNLDGVVNADDGCARWERLTPGQFITNTLSDALGSPLESLENADEIEEFLASMIQNLVMSLISDGISSLAGGGSSGSGSGGGFQQVVGVDQELIDIIEAELALSDDVLTLGEMVQEGITTGTLTISEIDDILDYMDDRGISVIVDSGDVVIITRTGLTSLQREIEDSIDDLSSVQALIETSNITDTYFSSLTSLHTQALSADTPSEIIPLYSNFNNLHEPIDTYSRALALQTKSDVENVVGRINETYNNVQVILQHLGTQQGDAEE